MALVRAILNSDVGLSWLLIEKDIEINKPDKNGQRPLEAALSFLMQEGLVVTLLKNKNTRIYGYGIDCRTMLGIAIMNGMVKAAKILIKRGADLKMVFKDDKQHIYYSALEYAKKHDQIKIIYFIKQALKHKRTLYKQSKLTPIIQGKYDTKLVKAIYEKDIPEINTLIKSKSNLYTPAISGKSPIELMVERKLYGPINSFLSII